MCMLNVLRDCATSTLAAFSCAGRDKLCFLSDGGEWKEVGSRWWCELGDGGFGLLRNGMCVWGWRELCSSSAVGNLYVHIGSTCKLMPHIPVYCDGCM